METQREDHRNPLRRDGSEPVARDLSADCMAGLPGGFPMTPAQTILEEAKQAARRMDELQEPIVAVVLDLLVRLDEVRGANPEQQRALVEKINRLLLRLDVHIACPGCGESSVLEYIRPREDNRSKGRIVAAHVFADPERKGKHAPPTSWYEFFGSKDSRTLLISREVARSVKK